MNKHTIAWTTVAFLAATLVPAAPAAADGIDGDCRGYDVFGLEVGGGLPTTGLLRLACLSARAECIDDDVGEVCRAGAGVTSIIGAGFCHRPAGPLPPPAAAACGGALDTAGALLAFTGCTDTVPVGDHRIVPGGFARVRQTDDGIIVIQVVADCGQWDGQCTFTVLPDGRTLQSCN